MNDSQLKAIARHKADIRSLRQHVDYWIQKLDEAACNGHDEAERQARRELRRFIDGDET